MDPSAQSWFERETVEDPESVILNVLNFCCRFSSMVQI